MRQGSQPGRERQAISTIAGTDTFSAFAQFRHHQAFGLVLIRFVPFLPAMMGAWRATHPLEELLLHQSNPTSSRSPFASSPAGWLVSMAVPRRINLMWKKRLSG